MCSAVCVRAAVLPPRPFLATLVCSCNRSGHLDQSPHVQIFSRLIASPTGTCHNSFISNNRGLACQSSIIAFNIPLETTVARCAQERHPDEFVDVVTRLELRSTARLLTCKKKLAFHHKCSSGRRRALLTYKNAPVNY